VTLRLTTYFGERDRADGRFLADALVEAHAHHEIRVSALVRGGAGFGLHHHFHTDTLLTLSEDLPMLSVAVDTQDRIEALLGEVERFQHTGLVTVERTELLDGAPVLTEPAQLTLYLTGRPAYTAACEVLHRHGVVGATVLLAVDGTFHRERRRATRAPAMVVAVGDGGALTAALPELPPCLATLDRIRIGEIERADGMWTKLTVHTHDDLIPRLRADGVRGATMLRGVWGFRDGRPPAGDRLLQIRRHVPALTVIVDAPDRIDRAYALVAGHGLVTSELLPTIGAGSRG
jgi:PII-like signaling protein